MPWCCSLRLSGTDLISMGSHVWGLPHSSPCLQLPRPPGICSRLQLLLTRSWPQRSHFSHFITITSDSNLLPNWVSSPKPDIQAVRWISSSSSVSLEAPGQLTAAYWMSLRLIAKPRRRPAEPRCWAAHRDLSSCLELIILNLLERLIKNRAGVYPLPCCFSVFYPPTAQQPADGGVIWWNMINPTLWDHSFGPFPFIVICVQIKSKGRLTFLSVINANISGGFLFLLMLLNPVRLSPLTGQGVFPYWISWHLDGQWVSNPFPQGTVRWTSTSRQSPHFFFKIWITNHSGLVTAKDAHVASSSLVFHSHCSCEGKLSSSGALVSEGKFTFQNQGPEFSKHYNFMGLIKA